MNFLITGSNGFIGSHLVSSLENLGNKVFKITSTKNGVLDYQNYVQFLEQNISVVVHLAGKTFVPESWEKPGLYLNQNINGVINSLEFCRKKKCKLIYISSYMYGNPDYLPVDENHPIKVFNPYGLSKRISEELCEFYKDNYDLSIVILRPFNIYGPRQNSNFLIPFILDQLMNGTEVRVKDLEPKRDYLFISDFVNCVIIVSKDSVSNGTYNIGSGISYTVRQIIEEAQLILGTNYPIINEAERRENEVLDVVADIKAIQKITDWHPHYTLQMGLIECIHHMNFKGTIL
jgi:nucleoside-diphosphate-sugar epimerase